MHLTRPIAKQYANLVAILLLAILLLALNITVASAKGPISGVITGPGIDQPIELVEGAEPDLVSRLMERTAIWFGAGVDALPQEPPAGDLGPGYELVWVNAGPPEISIAERTIRQTLYLFAEAGPLVFTPEQEGLRNWGPGVIGWYQAPDGLREALVALGAPIPDASPTVESPLVPTKFSGENAVALLGLAVLVVIVAGLGLLSARRALANSRLA
ncbi:MAG: hypothetical protein J5I90_06855 [Caldilineales bacterium]|nr:hypothetical protein [Caldilineales bacterium]